MIRLATTLSGLFLVACSANMPAEPEKPNKTPPPSSSQAVAKTPPRIDVTAMRTIDETKKQGILASCVIKRGKKRAVPTTFKLVSTSPDGTNVLYSDGGFLGGDHNVFDELTAIIKGDGHKAIITTPSELIMITVKGAGIGLNFRDGKLRCNGISQF